MTYTFDNDTISDLYKDANGFRPGPYFWDRWVAMTDDEKQATWDDLCETLECEVAREKEMEKRAIVEFEQRVLKTIEFGAADRETAIRWMMDQAEVNGDYEYFCWTQNLPYGYFQKVA